MITINHAFKIAGRVFPDGAKVDVHKHDDANSKTRSDMKQVCQVKSADSKNTV